MCKRSLVASPVGLNKHYNKLYFIYNKSFIFCEIFMFIKWYVSALSFKSLSLLLCYTFTQASQELAKILKTLPCLQFIKVIYDDLWYMCICNIGYLYILLLWICLIKYTMLRLEHLALWIISWGPWWFKCWFRIILIAYVLPQIMNWRSAQAAVFSH